MSTSSPVSFTPGTALWLSRTLDKVPVLLRQGSIVPLDGSLEPENGCGNPDGFEVVVVVGANGHLEILEEGEDEKSEPDWIRTPVSLQQDKGTITIGPTDGGPARSRAWSLGLLGFNSHENVRAAVNGEVRSPDVEVVDNGLVVRLGEVDTRVRATVEVGAEPQLSINHPLAHVRRILYDAEVEYRVKESIDAVMSASSVPAVVRASQLEALDMDADLRLVVMEALLADPRSS